MTPARAADLARALALVRPVSRRRLYFTARSVLVSDPLQVAAFDAVFSEVFGGVRADAAFAPDERARRRRRRTTTAAFPKRALSRAAASGSSQGVFAAAGSRRRGRG